MGLDDVRPFNFRQKARIPIFASADTLGAIQRSFQYIFNGDEQQSSVPQLDTHTLNGGRSNSSARNSCPCGCCTGARSIYGFRFGARRVPDRSQRDSRRKSMEQLRGLDVLFLDALRHKPHPTHSTVERSLQTVEQLAPRRAFFTHICHDLPHARTENALPPHIRLAYDGLEIAVEDAG